METIDLKQKVGELTVEQFIAVMKGLGYSSGKSPPGTRDSKQKLLNVKEAADLLGYEVSTIYDKTHKHLLPFLKKSRKLWFREEDLLAWAESGRKETVEELSKNLHLRIRRK